MSRKFRNRSAVLTIAFGVCALSAQTASDYFHAGAQQYIHGKIPNAIATISEGLAKYPNDPDLQALKGKIKEPPPQEQQNQQQGSNEQDQQGQQDQQKQNNQNKQDQQKKQQQDQQQNQQDKNQQNQQNQQNQNQQGKDQKDQQNQQPQQAQPQDKKEQDAKKEDAVRLLLQYSDDAKELNKPPEKKAASEHKPEKDW
jgi:type IV secretory pathway VirB10-like protein